MNLEDVAAAARELERALGHDVPLLAGAHVARAWLGDALDELAETSVPGRRAVLLDAVAELAGDLVAALAASELPPEAARAHNAIKELLLAAKRH